VFWSNWLVGSITTLALVLLFWPLITLALDRLHGARKVKGRSSAGQT